MVGKIESIHQVIKSVEGTKIASTNDEFKMYSKLSEGLLQNHLFKTHLHPTTKSQKSEFQLKGMQAINTLMDWIAISYSETNRIKSIYTSRVVNYILDIVKELKGSGCIVEDEARVLVGEVVLSVSEDDGAIRDMKVDCTLELFLERVRLEFI